MRPLHSNKTNIPLFVLDRSAEEIPIFSYLDELTNMPRPDECLFTRRNQEATLRPFFFSLPRECTSIHYKETSQGSFASLNPRSFSHSALSFTHTELSLSLSHSVTALSLSQISFSHLVRDLSFFQSKLFLLPRVLSLTQSELSFTRAIFLTQQEPFLLLETFLFATQCSFSYPEPFPSLTQSFLSL